MVELANFDILYQPHTTIKAQALADFVVELTLSDVPAEAPTPDRTVVLQANPSSAWKLFHGDVWKMYIDGASNNRGADASIVLLSPASILHENSLSINFPASNNKVEYEVLTSGLKIAEAMGVEELVIIIIRSWLLTSSPRNTKPLTNVCPRTLVQQLVGSRRSKVSMSSR